jgi:hypothetical protein
MPPERDPASGAAPPPPGAPAAAGGDGALPALGSGTGAARAPQGAGRAVASAAALGPRRLPAVHQHLEVLERAGLVEHRKDGRVRRCRLRPEPLQVVDEWVGDYRVFWDTRLDSLADHLKGANPR